MAKEDVLPGNNPDNVIREEEVAGHKVNVSYDKADTEFKSPVAIKEPEGLEGKDLETWHKDATNEVKMKRSASNGYDENAATKKQNTIESEANEKERKRLEKLSKELEEKKPTGIEIKEADFNAILAEKSGKPVNSKEDVEEILEEYPSIYHEANMEYGRQNRENMAKSFKSFQDSSSTNKVESALFRQKVENQGVNFDQLQAFAQHRGFPVNEYSLKAFRLENGIKSTTDNINNSIPGNVEIMWIPPGDVRTGGLVKTLQEEFPIQQDLADYVRKEREKPIADQDKRVIEMMK